ncbi:hypothetical protein SDC9_125550 [bioreactor metagenome]|uniref:Uncharacterized protein n=1 Tax=bioreactor metagenome TaxID=1076179 RepID=A0A645CNR8_9ZZZZ
MVIGQHFAFHDIGFADEVSHKAVFRLVVDINRRSNLLNLAVINNDDFITHCQRFFLIMSNIDKSNADFLLNFL